MKALSLEVELLKQTSSSSPEEEPAAVAAAAAASDHRGSLEVARPSFAALAATARRGADAWPGPWPLPRAVPAAALVVCAAAPAPAGAAAPASAPVSPLPPALAPSAAHSTTARVKLAPLNLDRVAPKPSKTCDDVITSLWPSSIAKPSKTCDDVITRHKNCLVTRALQ